MEEYITSKLDIFSKSELYCKLNIWILGIKKEMILKKLQFHLVEIEFLLLSFFVRYCNVKSTLYWNFSRGNPLSLPLGRLLLESGHNKGIQRSGDQVDGYFARSELQYNFTEQSRRTSTSLRNSAWGNSGS